jgi:predicted GIY-YIG superfamily endonuclease
MTYDYILQSINFPEEFYVGVTGDLKARLAGRAFAKRHFR